MKLLVVSHACATPINQQFFAEVQRRSGWSVTIAGPRTWRDDYGTVRSLERWPAFEGDLLPLPVWPSGNIPLHVYLTTFRTVFRDVQPDAVYVHHEPYAAATAQVYLANQLWHGCPIGFFTWQNIHKSYPIPFRHTEQMVYRTSDFACVGSDSAAAVLRAKGYDGPTVYLPGSINPAVHRPSSEAGSLRASLGVPPDVPLIGFMGRISAVKGLSTLMAALDMVRDEPWHLILVGDGPDTSALRADAAARDLENRMTITGYVPHTEAPTYLSMFDLLVLPSETQDNWKEQFGRVLVEALACGTPLLGSDSGEIPNVIARTGGGLSVPEGNSNALASALERLLQNPKLRSDLATTGRETVLREYTDEVLARRFIQTLETAASSRSGRSTSVLKEEMFLA